MSLFDVNINNVILGVLFELITALHEGTADKYQQCCHGDVRQHKKNKTHEQNNPEAQKQNGQMPQDMMAVGVILGKTG